MVVRYLDKSITQLYQERLSRSTAMHGSGLVNYHFRDWLARKNTPVSPHPGDSLQLTSNQKVLGSIPSWAPIIFRSFFTLTMLFLFPFLMICTRASLVASRQCKL